MRSQKTEAAECLLRPTFRGFESLLLLFKMKKILLITLTLTLPTAAFAGSNDEVRIQLPPHIAACVERCLAGAEAGERRFHAGGAAANDDQPKTRERGGRWPLKFPADLRIDDATYGPATLDPGQASLETGTTGDDVLLAPLPHLSRQIRVGH